LDLFAIILEMNFVLLNRTAGRRRERGWRRKRWERREVGKMKHNMWSESSQTKHPTAQDPDSQLYHWIQDQMPGLVYYGGNRRRHGPHLHRRQQQLCFCLLLLC